MNSTQKDLSIKTFILLFMGLIWKKVIKSSEIYCEHNMCLLSKNIVLKVLKYHIFSDTGFVSSIKPYMKKIIRDGFIMPHLSRKHTDIHDMVSFFGQAYVIVKKNYSQKTGTMIDEIDFINSFIPHLKSIIKTNEYYGEGPCKCYICNIVESWDINVDLLKSDKFQNVTMKGLEIVLNENFKL